jgi:hypothetical protein
MHLPASLSAETATQQPTSQPVDVDDHIPLGFLRLRYSVRLQSQLLSDERLDEHLNLFLSGECTTPPKGLDVSGIHAKPTHATTLHSKRFNPNYTFGTAA